MTGEPMRAYAVCPGCHVPTAIFASDDPDQTAIDLDRALRDHRCTLLFHRLRRRWNERRFR